MIKTELGPFLYAYNTGVATLSFSPAADRGALVRRIAITQPSATDNWTVTVEGKQIFNFRVRSTGSQNAVREDDQVSIFHSNFFDFCRRFLGLDPSVPVPLGQTITIASVGGATASILIEYEEHDNSDLTPALLNHPVGTEWLIPVYTYLNATVNAVGIIADDTQVGPSWLPPFFIGTMLTSAWKIEILAAFFQGLGVNTFSGAANHQSATKAKHLFKNGVDLFGRTIPAGIPNVGLGSAAGSANTVFGQLLSIYSSFERTADLFDNVLPSPVQLVNGDTPSVREEITGDVTGGASYEPELGLWIARVHQLPGG